MHVLVIILAETRAHELTFNRFVENVLKPLDADLAVCIEENSSKNDPFINHAKHIWKFPHVDDWAKAYDWVANDLNIKDDWKNIYRIKDQLWGGLEDSGHQGSAGILIFFRWFLVQCLKRSKVIDQYDYFIVTRSDYFYLAPHIPIIPKRDSDLILIPVGEDYGGITDRHIVLPRHLVEPALDFLTDLMTQPELVNEMCEKHDNWNLEKFIHWNFSRRGLLSKVGRFPRIMYAVRLPQGTTRWATGYYESETGQIVKYKSEYTLARDTVEEFKAKIEAIKVQKEISKMFNVFKKNPEAKLPVRADNGAAGYDLCSVEDIVIANGSQAIVDTGLIFSMPGDCYGRIAPRSGLAAKHSIDVMAGVIDSSYRGIVKVILYNHGDQLFFVKKGDRIAQIIFERIYLPDITEVTNEEELGTTDRGEGGFGSSGK